MSVSRRAFIRTTAAAASAAGAAGMASAAAASAFGGAPALAPASSVAAAASDTVFVPAAAAVPALVRPKRLQQGDVVGLIDPASATWEPVDVDIVEESLAALGLKASAGRIC